MGQVDSGIKQAATSKVNPLVAKSQSPTEITMGTTANMNPLTMADQTHELNADKVINVNYAGPNPNDGSPSAGAVIESNGNECHTSNDKNTMDSTLEEEIEAQAEKIPTPNIFLKSSIPDKAKPAKKSKEEKKKEKKEEKKNKKREAQNQPSIIDFINIPKRGGTKKNKEELRKKSTKLKWNEDDFTNSTPHQNTENTTRKKAQNREKPTQEPTESEIHTANYNRIINSLMEDEEEEDEEDVMVPLLKTGSEATARGGALHFSLKNEDQPLTNKDLLQAINKRFD